MYIITIEDCDGYDTLFEIVFFNKPTPVVAGCVQQWGYHKTCLLNGREMDQDVWSVALLENENRLIALVGEGCALTGGQLPCILYNIHLPSQTQKSSDPYTLEGSVHPNLGQIFPIGKGKFLLNTGKTFRFGERGAEEEVRLEEETIEMMLKEDIKITVMRNWREGVLMGGIGGLFYLHQDEDSHRCMRLSPMPEGAEPPYGKVTVTGLQVVVETNEVLVQYLEKFEKSNKRRSVVVLISKLPDGLVFKVPLKIKPAAL